MSKEEKGKIDSIIGNKEKEDDKKNKREVIITIIAIIIACLTLIGGFLIGRLTKKRGDAGENGADGIDGKDGAKGADGKDAVCDNDTCTKHQTQQTQIKDITNIVNDADLTDSQKVEDIKSLL